MVVFSVQLVFRDAPEHRHEPPTSQRSHSAVVVRPRLRPRWRTWRGSGNGAARMDLRCAWIRRRARRANVPKSEKAARFASGFSIVVEDTQLPNSQL